MPVSNSGSGKHKKYIEEKLSKLMPTLIKVGLGNFSVKIEIPKEEDEFTELLVALNLMIEELRAVREAEKRAEKAKEAAELDRIKILIEKKKELEGKVQERTKELQDKVEELEKFNKMAIGRELKMVVLKKEIERLKKELEK